MKDAVHEKDLVDKARKLGYDYLSIYDHCAPTTLQAISDTLDMKVSDETFNSTIGLSGWSGGCGGICGGIAAVGLYFGSGKEEFEANPDSSKIRKASEYIQSRFGETYGSFLCDDLRVKLFGRLEDVPSSEYERSVHLFVRTLLGGLLKQY